jgi:ParB-like chromosome segregation protein Spo0J
MTIETVLISALSEDPANARKHPTRNLEQIKASLRRFGQQKPIVVDATNTVRAGNGTLAAARALGWTTIQVVRSELPKTELTAYAIADNRTAELAEWDNEVLAATLADPEIGDVGFLEEEIAKLTGDVNDDDDEAADARLPPEKWLIVVTCESEAQQAELLERFAKDGLDCRALVG